MFNNLKRFSAAVLALGISTSAFALPSVTTAFTPGVVNNLSDDFGEIALTSAGALKGPGSLVVGDILFSILGITSYAPSGVPANTVNELTVLSAIEITSITPGLPDIACGATFTSPVGSCGAFTFKAPTIGMAGVLAALGLGGAITNPGALSLTANTVALFLEDTTPDFTTTSLITGTDGDLRLVVDLVVANGDAWTATGPTDIADFLSNTVGEGVGAFSLNLTITGEAFAGWILGPDFTGRGNLSRAEATAESPIGGDATFFFRTNVVPEPGTVALTGLGLALFGLMGLRRRRITGC